MEGTVGKYAQQTHNAEVREDAVHPQAAALGNAQRRLLPAIPVHVPAAGMQGNAKYKQQDRRHVHRPEKEPQQP